MATSATPVAAVRAAFSGLVDYAGLFPPAQLDMNAALAQFLAARRGPHAWMLARFITGESRLNDLLHVAREPVSISVIVDSGGDRAWFTGAQTALARIAAHRAAGAGIEMLEVPLPRLLSLRETYDAAIGQFAAAASQAGLRSLPSFIEVARDERWAELLPGAVSAMARHALGAKLRCGGANASAVPSSLEVATFLATVVAEHVPFKATAGLHHPVRGYDEERGFVMHGFLNVLTAAALARNGATLDESIECLDDENAADFQFDSAGLHWRAYRVSTEDLAATRREAFVSYGSCSFAEPVDDLSALGMIAA
jgi:hypothetical protein